MTCTRRGAGGDDVGGSGSCSNDNEDLPSPPHPMPAEMMASSWKPNFPWEKCCMVLHRMPAMDGEGTNTKGLNLTSSVSLRTFLTPKLLSLKK